MYRGFNLQLEVDQNINNKYLEIGKGIFSKQSNSIRRNFESYYIKDDILSAKLIMEDWFPIINCHVFLSHSHKDFNLALMIAGALKEELNIDTFIDSSIWGNSNDLLKKIDDKYCYNENTGSYIYENRNYSTTHVHLMLINALVNMINNTECLFFLNTPQSTSIRDEITNATNSPWIYTELNTAKTINKITPERLLRYTRTYSDTLTKAENLNESENKKFEISYDIELSNLKTIDEDSFDQWINQNYMFNAEKALNDLYKKLPINNKFTKFF